jgi:hypothetical protein
MRVLDPPKLVVVHRDGRWCDGELHAWLRDPDGWVGYVRYATSPGCGTWNGSLASACDRRDAQRRYTACADTANLVTSLAGGWVHASYWRYQAGPLRAVRGRRSGLGHRGRGDVMLSHYLCSSADKAEDAQATLRAHGYVEAVWGHACGRRMLLVPHPDAYGERVDHLVYRTDPAAQWLGPAIVRTTSQVRRVALPAALWLAS